MRYKLNILAVWGLVFVAACAKHNTPPPPEEDMLYRVECFFQTRPDSAMQILDTLNLSVLSEKERAHYCLLRAKVKDIIGQNDAEADSLLQVAENYFANSKEKYFEAMTYLFLARQSTRKGEARQVALNYRQKAMQSIEQCQHVDARLIRFSETPVSEQDKIDQLKYAIHQKLGMSYGSTGYSEESVVHLKAALQYYTEKQDFKQIMVTTYPLGLAYLALEKYDSCRMCFQNGLRDAQVYGSINDCVFYHICLSMYCIQRVEKQAFSSEEERGCLLRQMIDESSKGLALLGDSIESIHRKGLLENLSEAYYELQQYDSCVYYGTQAFEISGQIFNDHPLLKWLFRSHKALGDSEKANFYAEKLLLVQEKETEDRKAAAEVKSEYEKQMEISQLQAEQQLKRYRLYLGLALLALASLVVIVLVLRYRKNKELEALKSREAQRRLQSNLEDVTQHTLDVLLKRVNVIYESEEKDKLQRIMAEFEATYPKTLDKLKSAYPNLNESECIVAALNFMGFRIKEEAALLNLSENTVMKYRSNLKKLVDFDPISALLDQEKSVIELI